MAPPRKHDTDAILDATRELVLREGPRAASITAIAAGSGAPAGTLYNRFGSRDAILAAAWLRALERFQEGTLEAAAGPGGAVEVGAAMASATLQFARGLPEDALLLLSLRREDLLDAAPGPELQATLVEMNAPLAAVLARIARELTGRADARSLESVTRAVVDLPYAAVRRYAVDRPFPGWLERDVAGATRLLLTAMDAGRRPATDLRR